MGFDFSCGDDVAGRQLFDECIRGAMGRATRVMVTDHPQHIEAADVVLAVRGGGKVEVIRQSRDEQ